MIFLKSKNYTKRKKKMIISYDALPHWNTASQMERIVFLNSVALI